MSRVPVIPNAENCTQQELQTAAKAAPTLASHQRLMIMLALIQGFSADQVARLYGETRRTIQNYLRRFNEQGIDGLIEKKSSGRRRKISPQQSEQYIGLIEKPAAAGQTHWTGRKFHGYLREQLHQEIGYSTVVRWLQQQGYRLKVPQPWPDRQDEQRRQQFRDQLKQLFADDQVELLFLDETGVEGDPRPRRRWIKKGEKGRVTRNGDHLRMECHGHGLSSNRSILCSGIHP